MSARVLCSAALATVAAELRPVSPQRLIHPADRRGSDRYLFGGDSSTRLRLVQRDDTVNVACAGASRNSRPRSSGFPPATFDTRSTIGF